jgi:hypothetical protein
MDFSEMELYPENDTHTFVNGSLRYRKEMKAPLTALFTCEFYMRGEWVMRSCNRSFFDFCASFHMPQEGWFYYTKDYKGCPWKIGVIFLIKISEKF